MNVVNLKAGALGSLGKEQLEWLEKDAKRLKSSTPIVVFAHMRRPKRPRAITR